MSRTQGEAVPTPQDNESFTALSDLENSHLSLVPEVPKRDINAERSGAIKCLSAVKQIERARMIRELVCSIVPSKLSEGEFTGFLHVESALFGDDLCVAYGMDEMDPKDNAPLMQEIHEFHQRLFRTMKTAEKSDQVDQTLVLKILKDLLDPETYDLLDETTKERINHTIAMWLRVEPRATLSDIISILKPIVDRAFENTMIG